MTDPAAAEGALTAAAHLLARRVGLRLDPAIRGRLARCVIEEAAARRQDIAAYVATLEGHPTALQELLNRVTVQETSFFRDTNQFAALAEHVLPELVPPVTIWSAGCSNGQEPYSLAMALDEGGCPAWRVIATDVSTRALARARTARYSDRELGGVSPERRARYFVPAASTWEVAPALRARVDFAHHNLVAQPPPIEAGRCQVVFCRNVLIYFRHDDVVAFLEGLSRWLPPGGWLFLGYSESLWQVTDRFALVRLGDAFVYRRPESGTGRPGRKRADPSRAAAPEPRRRRVDPPPRKARAGLRGATAAARSTEPAPEQPATGPMVADLLAAGEAAITAGDYDAAVAAFRRCAYLEPDRPIAHLHLGLALEAAGDGPAARRAYAASRETLEHGDTGAVEATLEGYHVAELVRLLDDKLAEPGAPEARRAE
jgi:chemotaxis protein methyltransferase CheR